MARNSKLLTARQARHIDIVARDKFGISTLILMENAGRAVAEEARGMLGGAKNALAIFCGKGNNGGDGLVAARHLLSAGIKPEIFLAGRISQVKNEARVNLNILLRLRQKIIEVSQKNISLVQRKAGGCALIVDALLGVGLAGEVRGITRDLVALINAAGAPVLSIDIPSGLDAAGGKVLGCCVRADKTVTFFAKKRGMVLGKGPQYCGKIIVRGLGLPARLAAKPRAGRQACTQIKAICVNP